MTACRAVAAWRVAACVAAAQRWAVCYWGYHTVTAFHSVGRPGVVAGLVAMAGSIASQCLLPTLRQYGWPSVRLRPRTPGDWRPPLAGHLARRPPGQQRGCWLAPRMPCDWRPPLGGHLARRPPGQQRGCWQLERGHPQDQRCRCTPSERLPAVMNSCRRPAAESCEAGQTLRRLTQRHVARRRWLRPG